jgi:hypothetical protein
MVPFWSRDGKWIYFDSNRTGRFEVYKIPSKGGDEIQVTHNGGWSPQESVDGKYIFYTRTRAVSSPFLRSATDGSGEIQLLPSMHERWWAVSDKGVWFMENTSIAGLDPGIWSMESASFDRGSLRFLNFATGTITTAQALPRRPASGLAISADRRMLMFNQVEHRSTEIVMVENFR